MAMSRSEVRDWQDELVRIAPELPGLPSAAREAVLALVTRFAAEDAELGAEHEAVVIPLHAAAA
jgi:hypothetical protein